jgi:hypothetical protein
MIKLDRLMSLAIGAAAITLIAAAPACLAYDGPTFRSGLWKFERSLETDGQTTDRFQNNGLPIKREMTRCVNPTPDVKADFTPVEACKPRDIQKADGRYVIERVCGGYSPIKTEIDVKSDSAYTEINEGNIGKISTKETVVAQRIGDCPRRVASPRKTGGLSSRTIRLH